MTKLVKWIGLLFVAGSSPSCASTNLYDWATEKAPRSEVIGFVDGHGNGDVLLVRFEGEDRHPDGIYELSVFAADDVGFSAEQVAPRKLSDERLAKLHKAQSATSRVVRLDSSQESDPYGWWRVDGYELIDGALCHIEAPQRRYFVGIEAQIEPLIDSGALTKLAVKGQDSSDGPGKLQGVAYLPPARRETTRVVTGVVAAPLAVAVDVVTFPVQFLAVIGIAVLWSINPPDFFNFQGSWYLALLGFQDGRWFNAGDPEIPMLRCLFHSALGHPSTFVITSFLPLARNFPLVVRRALMTGSFAQP